MGVWGYHRMSSYTSHTSPLPYSSLSLPYPHTPILPHSHTSSLFNGSVITRKQGPVKDFFLFFLKSRNSRVIPFRGLAK
jgi:hypothetical protein